MPRKRRVGEMLLRQKAVKILRPRRVRSETVTDHPSNERTSHPPLQNSLLRSPLRPQRPFQADLPTRSLYRPAIRVKRKKGQIRTAPQLSAGTAPDGWASRHQAKGNNIFSEEGGPRSSHLHPQNGP